MVASGSYSGQDGEDVAGVTLEYDTATPNTTYRLVGQHSGIVSISDPCEGCNYQYEDYYDYYAYAAFGIDAPLEYEFLPQGSPRNSPQVIFLGSTNSTAQAATPTACNDQRDTIISEYVSYSVGFTPTCDSFTQSASTTNFTFNELNSGTYTWAILQSVLLTGIEEVRTNNGDVPLTVNSGYRNPAKEVDDIGGPSNSQHVLGDAVDFGSNNNTWQGLHDAGKTAGGCVEPIAAQNNSTAHCHIDFRGTCPKQW